MMQKILLVDDEPSVTNALKHTLFEEDYEVLTAKSGLEALKILRLEPVDVVVSDEKMIGMSGLLLLATVRRDYPHTVRIMLTGQASLEVALKAINKGEIYRFLTKPCNNTDFAITIRQALQQKKLATDSRKLLKLVQQQSQFIEKLKVENFKITKIIKDQQMMNIIDDLNDNVGDLLNEIGSSVEKSEKFFPEHARQNNTINE